MANKIDFGANTQVERSNSSEAFFSKYQKQILIAVVAVVLVIAGLLLYKAYVQAPREDKASTAIAKGQDYFNQEQFDKALNGDGAGYAGFVKIASDYSGTDAANLANLYAGLSYANLGKWNDALTYLEKFSTKSDAMVSPAAVSALGNAYAQTGNVDKAIAKGQDYFNQEQFDKALNGDGAGYAGFVKIASDYSGTDAANLANLYAGLSYANLGKWNDALTYLEKFSTKSDAMVSPAAVSALGNAYAQTGNVDKAIATLKKAADMADSKADDVNNSLSPTFLVQAGILLESQNKKDEALKLYQDIKKKYVNSTVVQSSEIDKYIERVSE